MIESSRTVESCLSFYHLCMKNNSLLQESFRKEPILGNSSRTPYIFKRQNEIMENIHLKYTITCKSGVLEGVKSPDNCTW